MEMVLDFESRGWQMKPLQGLYIIYVINNGRTDLMKCKESHPLRDAVGRGDRVKYHIQVLVF